MTIFCPPKGERENYQSVFIGHAYCDNGVQVLTYYVKGEGFLVICCAGSKEFNKESVGSRCHTLTTNTTFHKNIFKWFDSRTNYMVMQDIDFRILDNCVAQVTYVRYWMPPHRLLEVMSA